MRIERLPDAASAARRAAECIADGAREALHQRGRFLLALSGGATPLPMYEALAHEPLDWDRVALFQADERVVPRGSVARNWTHIERLLLAPAGLPQRSRHPMPADTADLDAAAAGYARTLTALAGAPPVLDLVHLGLGDDGHTASLFADDPALAVGDAWVAPTGLHHGHRRMTLTLPTLARSRCILWLVCGEGKAAILARLLGGDQTLPAARVARDRARIVADEAACLRIPEARELR